MLRKACSGEEAPLACHPPFAFWQSFQFCQWPISSVLIARQGNHLYPKGSCYFGPAQGCRHDLYNPGKNDQMALLSQGLGWQLSLPTATRSAGWLPARVQLRRWGDCHSWELGDRG